MGECVVSVPRWAVVTCALVLLLVGGLLVGGLIRQQQTIEKIEEQASVIWAEVNCSQIQMNKETTLSVFRPEAPDNWIANITKLTDIWRNENWGNWVFSGGNWALQKRSNELADGYVAPNYVMLHNTDMDTTYVFVNDSIGWIYIQDRNGQWWKAN